MFKLLALIICLIITPTVYAKTIVLKQGHPVRYTVQPGDTLWGLASRFLDDPLQWRELYHANPEIENPSRIYPGEVLVLGMKDGSPMLYVEGGGTLKLSPTVREEPLNDAIPVIPMNQILPFLNASRVVTEEEMDLAPFVVAQQREHVVTGLGDQFYAQDLCSTVVNDLYFIYRLGNPYVDPQTDEWLGYEAIHVGNAKVLRVGCPAKMLITKVTREIMIGDRLFPAQPIELNRDYFPQVPSCTVEGQIISVLGGVTQIGEYNIVVINRGARESLKVGDILSVYKQGELIANPVYDVPKRILLPDELAGTLILYQVYERVSYGLILDAIQPMAIRDLIKSPECNNNEQA